MNRQRLLERFLRYVRIDTTAREGADVYPSSPGQLDLGRLLVNELRQIGIADAWQDENGIVLATVPSNVPGDVPTIAWCAHLDTSPETSGADVRPQVIEHYGGGEIRLPGAPDRVIRPEENPELRDLIGRTIITSDGTTLLGADDKAGVAVIMEAAQWLLEHPELPRGPVRVCFTCDEEIGRGVERLDLGRLGAAVCYTLDGQGADTIDVETFSADLAVVTIRGVNVHPGVAKGRMTNAVRAAAHLVDRLPRDRLAPESTEDREGFLHPYEISGGVSEVRVRVLLRDFRTAELAQLASLLQQAADATRAEFPNARIDLEVKPQYRNMSEGLAKEPRAVGYARRALEKLGRIAKTAIVRGGTDGSRLTELGLPTPNLSTGEHSPHSPLEWACLDEMVSTVEWLVALAEVWCESSGR
ncbi:MAG: peptidase T [Thermoguttaceae bacterium]|nr:peptidase T [Thermoguttaceae bacterium]